MKSWRDTLVSQDVSLKTAIEVLDRVGLRIVLIVDDNKSLKGILTDGDVRRALLNHLTLETPVSIVMNRNPKTADKSWSDNEIVAFMKQFDLLQLPLINNEGVVEGVVNFNEVINRTRYDNPVFLMAGGFGTRLRPLTNNCPKPMLKVGDKPILELIMLNFISAGFYKFYISTHFMPDVIEDYFGDGRQWGVDIQYIYEEEPLGTGGALGLLPHGEINLPIFVMNGDLLTSLNIESFLEFHEKNESVATMCVREYEHQVPYGVISCKGSRVNTMIEKPTYKYFVNAGIYLLNPELVKSVKPGTKVDMPTLLESEINSGKLVNMFPVHEYWLDIGRMDDFKKAQNEIGQINGL